MGVLISLATRILGAKLAARWAKPLAVLLGLAGLLIAGAAAYGLLHLWLARHDAHVRSTYRADIIAKARARQVAAERDAGAKKEARDAQDRAEQKKLEDVTDEAARNGSSPLDALFNELR